MQLVNLKMPVIKNKTPKKKRIVVESCGRTRSQRRLCDGNGCPLGKDRHLCKQRDPKKVPKSVVQMTEEEQIAAGLKPPRPAPRKGPKESA